MEEGSVGALAAAIDAGRNPQRELEACTASASHLDQAGRRHLLAGLGELIQRAPLEVGGRIAICAGAIIERGADPADLPAAVFERLEELLDALPREAETETASENQPDPVDPPEAYFDFELAAISCLARSPQARREQRAHLWPRIHRYSEVYGFLGRMLSMLDEEGLVVIDVPTGRAWRVVIDGIADNFQLHVLLNGALARSPRRWPFRFRAQEGIAGTPMDPRAVASCAGGIPANLHVSSTWQLASWQALKPGGRLEEGHAHWIWNEGVPADIEPFDGTRVVLVAPGTIQRSWNSGRIFPAVRGALRVERPLTTEEAKDLVGRILSRRRDGGGTRGKTP